MAQEELQKRIAEILAKIISESTTSINEDTPGPGAPNIATTDENLSVSGMFQQTLLPSLGRQIFPVIDMYGPTAALFNLRKKDVSDDFELVRNNVEVYPSKSIPTNITQEVVQDIKAQYGKNANTIIGKLLRGVSNQKENDNTLAFLATNSKGGPNLTLTDAANSRTTMFEITQRVHELVLYMNSPTSRTYHAFCVLPYTNAASIATFKGYGGADDEDADGLFIGTIGLTKFFLNPDATATDAYVGLLNEQEPSKSSALFSPYAEDIIEVVNFDTGNISYHIFNRYAITLSPLSVANNEMLHSFTII